MMCRLHTGGFGKHLANLPDGVGHKTKTHICEALGEIYTYTYSASSVFTFEQSLQTYIFANFEHRI